MEIIEGVHFQSVEVAIDGKHFVDCTLQSCILTYSGGDVVFERTTMSRCRHVFYGQARSTLHYLQGVGLMDYVPAEWGEFPNRVH